jgi:TatD DNase family protein
MAIDTHAHIFDAQFDEDRIDVINRLIEAKIKKAVVVGFSKETNVLALNLAKEHAFLYPTAGLHPSEANEINESDIIDLEKFINDNKVYAIGECGLDYYWVNDNKEKQKWLFTEQIKLAIKYDLPLIIHCRDAVGDVYEILKEYKGKLRFVMHCYSGSSEMAVEFVKLGGMISLGGPVTFKNAKAPKEVAKTVPLDRLLIETDCPYLAPHPNRGKRNEPAYVRLVLNEIAALREIDVVELEEVLDQNSIKFFKLD